MRRPLSSSEVPWLVRLLLQLSDAFNAYFQLDQGQADESANTAVSSLHVAYVYEISHTLAWHSQVRPINFQTLCLRA